jgi:tetratricopeptide (TPR) repeat protein
MVDNFVLPHGLTKQIVQRAGGNPFFIEEVVRSLLDQGAIVRKEEGVEVTEKVNTITIPPTITDVLMARIDRLEEPTRYLVKVASVIGRSFFYRILSDVASEVDDIPGKLSFLSEIQLLHRQERMGEVKYFFKHALAQEAAYESILPPRRKELHLKVAHSIEKIFSAKLPECYGMLAYHYSQAEDREKTEEYLIKAGEEALRSAASDEALHYYEEALQLYLRKPGSDANPEKVAMLQKNIALALYNRGQLEEAVLHFNEALRFHRGKSPKHLLSVFFLFLSGLLRRLYFPSFKSVRVPTQRDIEMVDLLYKTCKALVIVDPKRWTIESCYVLRRVTDLDLTEFELGLEVFLTASVLFSFSGISFGLSRKILDSVKGRIDKQSAKLALMYELLETLHNYLAGRWRSIPEYDADLTNKSLGIGNVYDASQYLYWSAFPHVFQGSFGIAELMASRLRDIAKEYGNDLSLGLWYELNTSLLMESGKPGDALTVIDEGIALASKPGMSHFFLVLYSYKTWACILTGDIAEAEESLRIADGTRRQIDPMPNHLCQFYRSQLKYELYRLQESIEKGNRTESHEHRKKAVETYKVLLKASKKAAQHHAESYKLVGLYWWLVDEQGKALKWWRKAIEEGEMIGARLELSRVYFEVGKHLLEARSKYKTVNGMKADEYLEKARTLFEEMALKWDLNELDQVVMGLTG